MGKLVLAFQGVGKTTFVEKSELNCVDMDFKYYRNTDGGYDENWLDNYITEVKNNLQTNDYVFCNISKELMDRLVNEKINYVIVSPVHGFSNNLDEDFVDIKSLLFGRYVLRKTQTPHNVKWIERLKSNFDNWTDYAFFKPYEDSGFCKIIPLTFERNTVEKVLIH